MFDNLKDGDTITFHDWPFPVPSGRKWWQLWKPRTVTSNQTRSFTGEMAETTHLKA